MEPGGGFVPSTKDLRTALLPKNDDLYADLIADLHQSRPGRLGRPLGLAAYYTERGCFVRVTAIGSAIAGVVLERVGHGPYVGGGYRLARSSDWGVRVVWNGTELFDRRPDRPSDSIRIDFLTSTTFRAGERTDRHFMPLPEPARIVGSWIGRFEEYDPSLLGASPDEGASEYLGWVRRRVWLADAFQLTATTAPTGRGGADRVLGTRGRLSLQAREPDGERRRLLRALARFAFFSGTGYGTIHGLGQTVASVNEDPAPEEYDPIERLLAMHVPLDSGTTARLREELHSRDRVGVDERFARTYTPRSDD